MTAKIEHRNLQIRAAEGEEFVLAGRALSYNEISSNEICPGVRERICPGAFRDSLASGADVKALLNHDSAGLPLGRLANKTLTLTDDVSGLNMRVQLDKNNSTHRDVYASVKRGDISEMSFAFQCEDDDITADSYNGEQCQVRNVRKAKLFDVSVVCSAFYGAGATDVSARSTAAAYVSQKREWLKNHLADAARQERAHEIGIALLKDLNLTEKRGNDDWFADRAMEACSALGLDYCDHTNDYVYAADPDDDSEENCYRFDYECGEDGKPEIDEDSRTAVKHDISHSERGQKVLAERRQRKADSELRIRRVQQRQMAGI